MASEFLNTGAAAEYLGVSRFTLEAWRCQKKGPRFVKYGNRNVRYRQKDLDAYIEEMLQPTSQQA